MLSSKYTSYHKRLGPVHVVVMMNENPDYTKLSRDRYTVIKLTPELCQSCDTQSIVPSMDVESN